MTTNRKDRKRKKAEKLTFKGGTYSQEPPAGGGVTRRRGTYRQSGLTGEWKKVGRVEKPHLGAKRRRKDVSKEERGGG